MAKRITKVARINPAYKIAQRLPFLKTHSPRPATEPASQRNDFPYCLPLTAPTIDSKGAKPTQSGEAKDPAKFGTGEFAE
jgi:hypothetical protein